jgi:hypothetical protein
METYYVTFRDKQTGNRRQFKCLAEDFSHAEEQALPYSEDDEMIRIEKDFETSFSRKSDQS